MHSKILNDLDQGEFKKMNDEYYDETCMEAFFRSLASVGMRLFDCVKIVGVVIFLVFWWVETAGTRDKDFAVIHELSKEGLINITYHHDKVVYDESYEHGYTTDSSSSYFTAKKPSEEEEDILERKAEATDYKSHLKFKPGKRPENFFMDDSPIMTPFVDIPDDLQKEAEADQTTDPKAEEEADSTITENRM